ncbi:TPR domain protein [alpha proteobacterium BAL199]|jgi:tetratricopeptide (TPR) repeat protein|nr:TPR domain protein [alpha proteobacterium BAL199]
MGDPELDAPSVETGLALHRAGRLREAMAVYGQVLRVDKRQPAALHGLALALHQLGDHAAAEPLMFAAVRLDPRVPGYRNNFGTILRAVGQHERAVANFREALRLNPLYADARANLGSALPWLSHERDARHHLHWACLLEPAHSEGWASLGALERSAGQLERSITAQRRALATQPLSAAWRLNAGSALLEVERLEAARKHLIRAAMLDPGLAGAWNDLGYLLLTQLQTVSADRCFRHAAFAKPSYGAAWAGRAEIAAIDGDLDAAVRYANRAVEAEPGNPQLQFRRGIHRLAAGDLKGGWADHDAMWRKPNAVQRIGAPRRWAGDSLAGKTLLVAADQGIGDELLFSSCIPDAMQAADRVVLECDPRLETLFRRSFPGVFVHRYARGGTRTRPTQNYDWIPPDLSPDVMIEEGGLMRWFRSSVEACDAAGQPWLVPDPVRGAAMRAVVSKLGPGLKIGVSWRSMRQTEARNVHYPGLAALAPILAVPGVTFVCLQYGAGWQDELRASRAPVSVVPGLDTTSDIEGVAALAASLDGVICPSSTIGWIGAGVGTSVWLLSNEPVFLEFGLKRLPGFPTVRPFSKRQTDPWQPMLAQVAQELAAWSVRESGGV